MKTVHVLRDIVIIVPGITGSVLERDGREVWGLSTGALWRAAISRGDSLRQLVLKCEDCDEADFEDGVTATRLMPDAHLVPGLCKIDGYSTICRLIRDHFQVLPGDPARVSAANYFEFPYDWRRDNRRSAECLGALVDTALPLWKQHSGADDAKVIILAHSMGGLVARHWLEVLRGWRHCRALITFGTPFRGAPKAAGFIANGYKNLFDLSETMRSFTSSYQLLPIYPALQSPEGAWMRIAECDAHRNIRRCRAQAALKFHRDIEEAVTRNRGDPKYMDPRTGYRILPVVGVAQPTTQSVLASEGALTPSDMLPDAVHAALTAGHGTVPRVSATPIELSGAFSETFMADMHSALQGNRTILDNLVQQLIQMQARSVANVRGPVPAPQRAGTAGLALFLEDFYVPGDVLQARVELRELGNAGLLSPDLAAQAPNAWIRRINNQTHEDVRPFVRDSDGWRIELRGLSPGTYRIEVSIAELRNGGTVTSVRDLFEIANI
jgi:pimeloyl-ACP methyl ester carboxylesterase